MIIRNIEKEEIQKASDLADTIYPIELYESNDVFFRRYELYPQGIFGAFNEGELIGYIFSHPWTSSCIVPLNSLIVLPQKTDSYYIHDVAVLKRHRGMNIAKKLVESVIEVGIKNGYNDFRLVSVNNTETFWNKFGFNVIEKFEYADGIYASKMKFINE